jgi:hypothetical protein
MAERWASLVATAKFWVNETSSKDVNSVIVTTNTANMIISALAIVIAFLLTPFNA